MFDILLGPFNCTLSAYISLDLLEGFNLKTHSDIDKIRLVKYAFSASFISEIEHLADSESLIQSMNIHKLIKLHGITP